MKKQIKQLIEDFKHYKITPEFVYGRIELQGGDDTAREHYSALLAQNSKIEINLILELAKIDEYVYDVIDERAAIREAENLPGDFESAVRCAFEN